jgi:hypothetical protein
MKKILLTAAGVLLAAGLSAAPLDVVHVSSTNIACLFDTNCAVTVDDSSSPITLPNTTGTGLLQTRIIEGGTGSDGEGLFAYLYRVDLTGITSLDTNAPCFTNVLRCTTNRIVLTNFVRECRTNVVVPTNRLVCVTNRFLASNVVVCFTNTIPATNFVRCVTNSAGALVCTTNFFPGTNFVACFTNRFPATNVVTCAQTNLPGGTNIVCTTNRVLSTSNVVTCVTNRVTCPGTAPCVETVQIRFGPAWGITASNGTSTGQVFVVSSDGIGTIAATSADQDGAVVTLNFATPICAGESSYFVGLISSNAPHNVNAVVELTSGSNLLVAARAPLLTRPPIECDFATLRDLIRQLGSSELLAPNNNSREGRRGALLNGVDAAIEAAAVGDAEGVLGALKSLEVKARERNSKWFSPEAAQRLRTTLEALRLCVENAVGDRTE